MELSAATAAPKVLTFGDKQYTFSRLTLRDWGELEVAALDAYRREFLQVRLHNADLLAANGDIEAYRKTVIAEAIGLKMEDLPKKRARVMVMTPTGQPVMIDNEYQFETKEVDYQVWWFNETLEGRLFAIWLSLRKAHPNLSLSDVDNLLMEEFMRAGLDSNRLANMVGEISSPSVGNSQPPPRAAAQEQVTGLPGDFLSGRRARRIRRRQRG